MKVEAEFHEIRDVMLALMDKNFMRLASIRESKVLYFKVKGACYRNLFRVCPPAIPRAIPPRRVPKGEPRSASLKRSLTSVFHK